MIKKNQITLLILFIFSINYCSAQFVGKPLMRYFSPEEYNWHSQNYDVIQDNRGIMYFANAQGVLEYDGNEWRKILLSNNLAAVSFAKDSAGKIYVGGEKEIGFIAPDSLGQMKYFSLKDRLDSTAQHFRRIWQVMYTPQGVYFRSNKYLIRYNYPDSKKYNKNSKQEEFTVWKTDKVFYAMYFVDDIFYIHAPYKGLQTLQNDSLTLVKNGEFFHLKSGIVFMNKVEKNKILIINYQNIFLYDTRKNIPIDSIFTKTKTKIDSFINKNYASSVLKLQNENYIFETYNSGILITDKNFNPIQIINKSLGLTDNSSFGLYYSDNIIWHTSNEGITIIEPNSSFQMWDENLGLNTNFIIDIIKYNNKIYLATPDGIFYLDNFNFTKTFIPNMFHKIVDFSVYSVSFLLFNNTNNNIDTKKLLLAAWSGVYEIDENNNIAKINKTEGTATLHQSKINPNLVFLGTNSSLQSMYYNYKTDKWIVNDLFSDIQAGRIRTLVEDNDSIIWFSDNLNVYKIMPDYGDQLSNLKSVKPLYIEKYDTTSGLPIINDMRIYEFQNNDTSQLLFATAKGIYIYNKNNNRFEKDDYFYKYLNNQEKPLVNFTQDKIGNIFFDNTFFFRQNDNSFITDTLPFKRIQQSCYKLLHDEQNNCLWFGTSKNILFSKNLDYDKNYSQDFNILIRNVKINNDSVLFHGTFYKTDENSNKFIPVSEQTSDFKPIINYKDNSISFTYSAQFYLDIDKTKYSLILKGFDNEWSEWTSETKKEYTNLPEGKYIFQIKAKNIYGYESKIVTYEFTILPPWSRTWWAYTGYIILLILFIFVIVKLALQRVVKQKIKLEKTVKERTAEIVQQKYKDRTKIYYNKKKK